ncbi:MAG: hypothetical protein WCO56_25465 [Verrucomicrobiota bacterium]
MSLEEHLMSLNGDVLKGWLRHFGLGKGLTRKDQFVQSIGQQLAADLPAILARMSEAERHFLAESAHQGQIISDREFTAKYGGRYPMPSFHHSWNAAVSLLVPFIQAGDYRSSEPPTLIPTLVEPLRRLLPKPEKLKVRTVEQLPKAWPRNEQLQGGDLIRPLGVYESERIAPVELGRVLRLIQGGKVKVTDATRRPTEATTRLVGMALVVPDFDLEKPKAHLQNEWEQKYYTTAGPVRAHAWPVLMQQCGWAKARNGALGLTEAGSQMLRQFSPVQFQEGIARFLDNSDFDELNRINHIRGQSGKGGRWLSDPAGRKEAISEAISDFPVGDWLAFEEAQRIVESASGDWKVLETQGPALYFFEPQYGFITDNTGLGRQYLRAFLLESLATLGLFDVAYVYPHGMWPDLSDSLGGDLPFCSRYDGLVYVRLNPLGAWALGFADHYDLRPLEETKLFRVLPSLELELVDAPLNPADRATLELLAAPKTDQTWALDAMRILEHVEGGGALNELYDFLAANASDGIPETVGALFQELHDKMRACRTCQPAVLLEWEDELLVQRMASSAELSKLCFPAGGNRLAVPASQLAAFRRALKRMGYVLPPAS